MKDFEKFSMLEHHETTTSANTTPSVKKESVLITAEALILAGWRKLGGAWYGSQNRKLTNSENKWQFWRDGKEIEVTMMDEL